MVEKNGLRAAARAPSVLKNFNSLSGVGAATRCWLVNREHTQPGDFRSLHYLHHAPVEYLVLGSRRVRRRQTDQSINLSLACSCPLLTFGLDLGRHDRRTCCLRYAFAFPTTSHRPDINNHATPFTHILCTRAPATHSGSSSSIELRASRTSVANTSCRCRASAGITVYFRRDPAHLNSFNLTRPRTQRRLVSRRPRLEA